jgi:regulator of protease activity HflC (stomatin/prohibitin superfamily)
MRRAMSRQAEAEREKTSQDHPRRGGVQAAAATLARAADELDKSPSAMQLRYLQTLTEIASERNSTLIFPDSGGAAAVVRQVTGATARESV